MHILIGIITAIGGLLWALHSLQNAGVDLNAFNPFTWLRRRRWEKQLGTKPRHALTDTMDAAALLAVAIAKEEGEITRDTKLELLSLFEETFGVSRKRAIEMFSTSSYMLSDVMDMVAEVRLVLKPSKADFTSSHIQTLLTMLQLVSKLEGDISSGQQAIIQAVKDELLVEQ